MLLTKGETGIGLLKEMHSEEILYRVCERFGSYDLRRSLASGYVRKGFEYLSLYDGRFGVGVTIRYRCQYSTRYCEKETFIFKNVSVEEIDEVITATLKRYGIERSYL